MDEGVLVETNPIGGRSYHSTHIFNVHFGVCNVIFGENDIYRLENNCLCFHLPTERVYLDNTNKWPIYIRPSIVQGFFPPPYVHPPKW